MKTKVIAILVILAIALTATMVVAQKQRCPKPAAQMQGTPKGCAMGPGLMAQLKLTPEQVKSMQALRQEYATETKPIQERLRVKCGELCALWAGDATPGAVKVILDEMDTIRAELRNLGVDYAFKAWALLTAEQQAKVKAMLKTCAENCAAGKCATCPMCKMGLFGFGMGGPGCGMGPGGPNCPMGTGQGPAGCPMGGPRAGAGCCPLGRK